MYFRKRLGRAAVISAVLLPVLSGATVSGSEVLFADDFSGDLSQWEFSWDGTYDYGITDADGTPPPCLFVDDFSWGGTEAVSVWGFEYVGNDFTFSTDLKNQAVASQRRATIGLKKGVLAGSSQHAEAILHMLVQGDHWDPQNRHTVRCKLLYEDGGEEFWEDSGCLSIPDGEGWHNGGIKILDDMRVEFRVDDMLYYTSNQSLTTAYNGVAPIYVGSRTSRYDNVLVTPEPVTLTLLGFGALGLLRRRH